MMEKASMRRHTENGNAMMVVLAVVLLAVLIGIGYFVNTSTKDGDAGKHGSSEMAHMDEGQDGSSESKPLEIKPGNPVVAKLGSEEIKRMDVFQFIQTLPANARQLPMDQLFPSALEQIVNMKLVEKNTANVKLDNDPEVKERLEEAKKNIVRGVFIEKEVEKRLTEDKLKKAYEQYVEGFPKIDEVRASHILVEDKAKAEELLKQLKDGASFEELAKENSTDGTAEEGGDLGYFSQSDVVEPFAMAAFNLEKDEMVSEPVQTDFGYHIIKVTDKRIRPPAKYEEIMPLLEPQLRQATLNDLVREWRQKADVELFDINGEPQDLEPAAGE